MQDALKTLPAWLLMLIGFMMVTVLGYIDYLTGDYSLLIFYVIPITLGAWFLGYLGAVVISLSAGLARLVSDYFSYSGPSFKLWNSLQDMVFLIMVGLLIATVKRLLDKEQREWDK